MSPFVIIHYQPVEGYPPVQNLIIDFHKQYRDRVLYIFTTSGQDLNIPEFKPSGTTVRIVRFGKSSQASGVVVRIYHYLLFNIGCLAYLMMKRPRSVFYYESLSAFPIYIYNRFFKRNVNVFIHYHEYTAKPDYESGMILVKIFHGLERWLYKRAKWISHTNHVRLEKFQNDENLLDSTVLKVFPNYPPGNWRTDIVTEFAYPIRIIYVGALGMESMYLREFAEWVHLQNGKVTLDIYSLNISDDARLFLKKFQSPHIIQHSAIPYAALPEVLSKYHVGVILYKGHIENYIHNAPNKLFEYLSCGLDVWVPDVMEGCFPYITQKVFPKVIRVDFTKMEELDLEATLDRTGLMYQKMEYNSEDINRQFLEKFIGDAR